MNFSDKLNNYIEIIGCTNKQLSNITGIAPPIISGYRNGNRFPKYDSEQFKSLVDGIVALSKEKNIDSITKENVEKDLAYIVSKIREDEELLKLLSLKENSQDKLTEKDKKEMPTKKKKKNRVDI